MAINLSLPPLSSDTVYKATFFVAFVGCVLTFLGLAIAQSGLTGSITANPLGVGWYLGFLQWAILAYSVYAYRNSSLNANKLAIVGLIAAYAGPFPTQLGGFIITNQSSFAQGNLATGCGFLAAGFILTIFPFLAILLMLGTADDMKFGLIDRHQSTGTNAMHNNTATLHNNTAQNSNTQNSNSHKETVVQINSTPAQTVVAEYAYAANASDPHEVSFDKGQVMALIDAEGKWWQVKFTKPDGTEVVGIAPSNYLKKQ